MITGFSGGVVTPKNGPPFSSPRRPKVLAHLRDLAQAMAHARRASVRASLRASRRYANAARRCSNQRALCCQASARCAPTVNSRRLSAAGARGAPARTACSRSVAAPGRLARGPDALLHDIRTLLPPSGRSLPSVLRGSCSALLEELRCRKLLQAAGMAVGRSLAAGQRSGRPPAAAGKGAVASKTQRAGPPFWRWHRLC